MTNNNCGNTSELTEIFPGTKLLTIRELVKTKQNQRTHPTRKKSVQRAEDQLMKWQPSINSHKEIIAAVEGDHPYQQLQENHFENVNANNSNIVIQHWYNEDEEFFSTEEVAPLRGHEKPIQDINHNKKKIESENVQEDIDSFVITPTEPLTCITPFGTVSSSRYSTHIRTSTQANNNERVDNMDSNNNEEVDNMDSNNNANNDDHNQDRCEPLSFPQRSHNRPESVYRLYYQKPVPMSYIDQMCESPCDISVRRRDGWDQSYNDFESNESFMDGILFGCLAWMGCKS
ncbi:hypothetical protein MOUN0_N05688 [Monosporozyma unispora]|nr:hypothetical protein C6P44_003383 [Kazachstania unispora]